MRYTEAKLSPARRRDARGHRPGHRRLPAELRREYQEPRGPARQVPQPAGQRLQRHRRRAWPPPSRRTTWARSGRPHRLLDSPDLTPDERLEGLIERIPGPDFPTGGTICGRSGHPRGLSHGPRPGRHARQARDRGQEGRQESDRLHRDPLPAQQDAPPREARRAGQRTSGSTASPTSTTRATAAAVRIVRRQSRRASPARSSSTSSTSSRRSRTPSASSCWPSSTAGPRS